MKFVRNGKAYQLVINTPQDLVSLLQLDDSFWAATSAPKDAFRGDAAFFNYLDTDKNGRILSHEVRAAVKWLLEHLSDTSKIGADEDTIALESIRKESDIGEALLTTANYVNEQEKRTDGLVALAHVRAAQADLRSKPLNGDGILIAEAALDDAELGEYIKAAISSTGGSPDISGKTGVSGAQLDAFAAAIHDFLEWKKLGSVDNTDIFPFGAETPALYALCEKHRAAIDRFFFLAGFQRYDASQAARFINPNAATDDATAAMDAAPLARPLEDGSLALTGPAINPLRRDLLDSLRTQLFEKVLGKTGLAAVSEQDWLCVQARLKPYADYLAQKKGAIVEALPLDKLEAWDKSDLAKKTAALQAEDAIVAKRVAASSDLEKLLLFHRHLLRFVNNYVSLTEFYNPKAISLFERGRLLIDGRWFNLCIEVANPAAHAAVAKNSGLFTLYVQVTPIGKPAFTVVVPATAGTRGNLAVGKRGVFYDLDGVESDAVVTSLIAAPISLREAMLAPFSKIAEMLLGKIEALSSSAQSAIEKSAEKATNNALEGKTVTQTPPPAPAGANMGNLFMGISVSIAALGSAFAFFAKSFSAMSVQARIMTALTALLVIIGPILLAGVVKLFRQDISPILEGSGWAVNNRMGLTRRLRRQFTVRMPFPKNADGTPARRFRFLVYVVVDIILLGLIVWQLTRFAPFIGLFY